MNDGPLCKCSAKARRTGIRHGIYPGEEVSNSKNCNYEYKFAAENSYFGCFEVFSMIYRFSKNFCATLNHLVV